MPVFTLPPDTRSVGSPNPAGDMNAVTDALLASGAGFNVLSAAFAGGADPTGAADSTAAFAAAIAAAIAANGAEVIVPPGQYTCNVPSGAIPVTGPFKIRGLGTALNAGGALVPAVQISCNGNGSPGSNNLLNFPFQGYLWSGLEIENIAITYSGTGAIFNQPNIADSVFRDMACTVTNGAGQIISLSGSVSFLNILHERCNMRSTSATRSRPMISISTNTAAAVSNNTWFKCKFSNDGLDNTQYMVFYTCTAASTIAYHYMDSFIECWFEHPFGGALQCLAGESIKLDGCTVWDIFSGATVGKSTFYFGAQPSGANCQGIEIKNCGRSQAGPDGAATWDVECEATTAQVRIEGWVNKPATASTQTNFFVNLHACLDVLLLNNQSPQGASVNGNSTTVITNPSATQQIITQGNLSPFTVTGTGSSNLVAAQTSGDTVPRISMQANGTLEFGPGGAAAQDTGLTRAAAGILQTSGGLNVAGRLDITNAGSGLRVAEGSNCKQGTVALVAGAATVANTSVTATSRIFLTSQADGGTPGWLRVSARTAGTSFTITSSSGTDTSTVAYEIFEVG